MTEGTEAGEAAVTPSCLNMVQKMPLLFFFYMYLSGGGTGATAHLWKLTLPLCWFWGSNLSDLGNKHLYLQSCLTGPQNVVVDLCACVLACLF